MNRRLPALAIPLALLAWGWTDIGSSAAQNMPPWEAVLQQTTHRKNAKTCAEARKGFVLEAEEKDDTLKGKRLYEVASSKLYATEKKAHAALKHVHKCPNTPKAFQGPFWQKFAEKEEPLG